MKISHILLFITALLMSFSLFAKAPRIDNTRLLVKLEEGTYPPTLPLITKPELLYGTTYIFHTKDARQLKEELKKYPNVLLAEFNYYADSKKLPEVQVLPKAYVKRLEEELPFFAAFNDPKVGRIWSFLDANKNGVSVNKAYLSSYNYPREEVIVAVVDTGVDYNHEDLKDVMWRNPGEIAGNGIDDDNNGYIDDVFGIDTLNRDSQGRASGNPMASHAHGTHVSGTIGATQNNGIGIAGIASDVKIMAIRTVPDNADETDVDIVESFLYAARNGARLINCSFGKSHNEGGMIVNETIDHIGKNFGTLVLAAAGNEYHRNIDRSPKYPASFESDYLMVVASTTSRGSLSYFSNIGKKSVDIAAPGSDVYSTIPGGNYGSMSGTSMATPTTVGVAAQVLSNFPTLGPIELKQLLMDSVTKVSRFNGLMVSEGRVDLYNALKAGQ